MSRPPFMELLRERFRQGKYTCVGLDPDKEKLPEHLQTEDTQEIPTRFMHFGNAIAEATSESVCAFKPNIAFYEAYGHNGIAVLSMTCEHIRKVAPEVPIILDAKRADIGNTNAGYVRELVEYFKADAITVSPYLGGETLKPFLKLKDKGIIVLCKTSNKGADEFQNLPIPMTQATLKELGLPHGTMMELSGGPLLVYEYLARRVAQFWNENGNCCVVVGATNPTRELARVRELVGVMPMLIPGIGAQSETGNMEEDVQRVVEASFCTEEGKEGGIIVNASRSTIYASSGKDFAEAAQAEARKLNGLIVKFIPQPRLAGEAVS